MSWATAEEPSTHARSERMVSVADGGRFPVVELRAPAPGPTLGLVAGVHGDEPEGVAALASWLAGVELERGRVLAVPVAALAAQRRGTRLGPDGGDLNRSFEPPAQSSPSPTRRLAAALAAELLPELDALVTLHSWSRPGETVPYVEFAAGADAAARAGERLARSLGIRFVESYRWLPGLLPAAAHRAGIPAAEVEVGGLGRVTPAGQATLKTVLDRASAFVLGGADAAADAVLVRRSWVAAEAGGRVEHVVRLGDRVAAGDPVAVVRDPFGAALATLAAPAAGTVAVQVTHGAVEAGEPVAVVFTETPA